MILIFENFFGCFFLRLFPQTQAYTKYEYRTLKFYPIALLLLPIKWDEQFRFLILLKKKNEAFT